MSVGIKANGEVCVAPCAHPAHWRKVRLGDLGVISGGSTPSTKTPEYWSGDIPWLTPNEVSRSESLFLAKTARRITATGLASCSATLLPPGTVMMTSRATIGEVAINMAPMATNQGFINVACNGRIAFNEFLAYWLILHRSMLVSRASGSTFLELSKSNFRSVPIVLPPLPEQRAIARTLRAVRDTIQARRREVELERERKAALMHHLFTHGTRGEPTKLTEIGEMPESWQVVRFADIVDIVQGQVDPRVEPYRSMLHAGPENIEAGTGKLLTLHRAGNLNLISGKYLFTPDHVLYSKIRPYLRKAALPTFTGICSADMYPLRPYPERLLREFLLYVLLSERFTKQITASQDRTGIPKVNRNQLGAVRLPVPSSGEQRAIADILGGVDARIAALEVETTLLDELFRALLEELMTGQLRVGRITDV